MRSDDDHASAGYTRIGDLGCQHHASSASDFALNLLLKNQLARFAFTFFQRLDALDLIFVPIMRLVFERFESHVLQREATENGRAMQPSVKPLINSYFPGQLSSVFLRQFFKLFESQRDRIDLDEFDTIGVIQDRKSVV